MKEEREVRKGGRLEKESRSKVYPYGVRRMGDGKEGPQEGLGATQEKSASCYPSEVTNQQPTARSSLLTV